MFFFSGFRLWDTCVSKHSEDDFIQWGTGFLACRSKNNIYKNAIGKNNSQNAENS